MGAGAQRATDEPGLRRPAPIFPVRDLNDSLAFYQRLSFGTEAYDEGYGFARRERLHLHLRVVAELDPFANNSGVYVDTADVDALHAEWLGCGLWVVPAVVGAEVDEEARRRWRAGERPGRITDAVEAKPWGVREFTVLDPDHNQLRFGQAIG